MTVQPSTAPMPEAVPAPPARAPGEMPAPAPAPRAATQMSPSAVPSTLDSPTDGASIPPDGAPRDDRPTDVDRATRPTTVDEIDGALLIRAVSAPPAALSPAPPLQLWPLPAPVAPPEPSRRGAPATLMSPAVPQAGDVPPSPPPTPENAVVDVGAPAHAFMPRGNASPHGYGGAHGALGSAGRQGPGPSGTDAGRRGMTTTFLVMVALGVVAGIVLLGAVVGGLFYVTEKRRAERERLLHAPSGAAAAATAEGPRGAARFGGGRARLGVTTTGTLDPEAIRVALAGALPRIDACFAAAELEPPNHESAAYDLDVQPTGDVKRADAATTTNRTPKLDACVLQNLRSARLPKAAKASTVKLTFSAPVDVR
jgi:hypothetical protein